MTVSATTYERVALEDPDSKWEMICGRLRRKPPMTYEHNDLAFELAHAIRTQLNPRAFRVRCDQARVQTAGSYFIPDVFVVPVTMTQAFRGRPETLEVYAEPLPLVVEVWSRSTGEYDVNEKLAEYRRRGDREIWLVHPYERTLTTWRRKPDGSYQETVYEHGELEASTLPGVTIDLEGLFGES
jgi:Uma2 family endonuclease